jgi:predicted TIM-barrel fold metal-dependent hydrolase
MRNAPKKFLQLYLPKIAADAIDHITEVKVGSWTMSWLLKKFGGNWGKRYASFLSIGKSEDQLSVFETLMAQYSDNTMKFVALSMYMEKSGADLSETGFEGQLEELMVIKKQYPDNLLIFLGIDPRWKLTGKELRKTVEKYFQRRVQVSSFRSVYPFTGLKIYPSMGFYAFDKNLKEIFEWASDNGVPVLSHCNYLGGIFNNDTSHVKDNLNPFDVYSQKLYADNFPGMRPPQYHDKKNFFKKLLGVEQNAPNLNTCSYFLEPISYKTMVEYFSKKTDPLKICLAHFGGDAHIIADYKNHVVPNLYGMLQQNWCAQIKDLMIKYPGIYTDIAYAVAKPGVHDAVFKELDVPAYGERILFGTDFFLTERELPEKNDYEAFKDKALHKRLPNFNNNTAWEQVAGNNVERFLKSRFYDGSAI